VGGSCDEDKGYIDGRERTSWRPTGRRIDAVDIGEKNMLKGKNWRRSAERKDVWRRGTEEAKAQVGL
jgi:hypothetical protein